MPGLRDASGVEDVDIRGVAGQGRDPPLAAPLERRVGRVTLDHDHPRTRLVQRDGDAEADVAEPGDDDVVTEEEAKADPSQLLARERHNAPDRRIADHERAEEAGDVEDEGDSLETSPAPSPKSWSDL